MKRLLTALTIGVLVSTIVLALHISGAAWKLELPLSDWISRGGSATKIVSDKLQYPIVFLVAAGVAWLVLETRRRDRMAIVIGALAFELLAVAWVCGLYQTFYQPLPAMLAALLSLGGAAGFIAVRNWLRERAATAAADEAADAAARKRVEPPAAVVPPVIAEQFVPPSLPSKPIEPSGEATSYQVTAVVCDIGNKHDLIDELEPAALVEMSQRFIAHATKVFSDAGAYIDSASADGVVAIFGFPEADAAHAEKATHEAMRLVQNYPAPGGDGSELFELHAGVSSGKVVIARSKGGSALTFGEPIELARRFCIANRFYGSRVLIGPDTFEAAANSLVARPIDFLTGVDARERHEIYEPLSAAGDAAPEQIQRRDFFWSGVVLYREKRWAEAYTQFQRARGPDDAQDAPLQLYLRRLEPLALQLTDTPFDE